MTASPWVPKPDGFTVLAIRFPEMSLRGPRLLRQTALWIRSEIERGLRPALVIGTLRHTSSWAPDSPNEGLAGTRERDRARAAAEDLVAALLAVALVALGVRARSLWARDAELEAVGPFGAGVLEHLDARYLDELLADQVIPILPGGHAVRPDGETVMLGRPGADLTAVTLAAALAVPCHLLVDQGRSRSARRRLHPGLIARAHAFGVTIHRRTLDPWIGVSPGDDSARGAGTPVGLS